MKKVLVVDDSAPTRTLIRAILEEDPRGVGVYEVVEASSGFEAMRLLPQRGPFELVVTDINMVDINGLELIRFIRSSSVHARTPIVVISTQKSQRDIERALTLGANVFVPKPFTADTVHEAVRKAQGGADG